MWLKMLSLLVLGMLSLSVQASPFAHQTAKSPKIALSNASVEQYNLAPETLIVTALDSVCFDKERLPPELECCHIDSCSVLILNDIKNASFDRILDSRPVLSSWPYKPIFTLKKPPKLTAV